MKTVGKHSLSVNSCAHIHYKQIYNQLLQQWHNDGSSNKNTYYFMFDDLPLNKMKNDLVFGFST